MPHGTPAIMPAAIRSRTGNAGNRGFGLEVVAPIVEQVEPPDRLSPAAAELWPELVAELSAVGLLTTLDLTALEMLCEAYSDWINASEELAQNMVPNDPHDKSRGYRQSRYISIKDNSGNMRWIPHPALAAMQDADRRIRHWLLEFGLTPAARARWKRPDAGVENPAEDEEAIDIEKLSPHEREALRQIIDRRSADGE